MREWPVRAISVPKTVNPERDGPFSWEGYEFAPHMLERIFAPETRVAVMCAPPQFIKTFLSTVGILYAADQLGVPQMYVTTTGPKRDEFVDQKLKPLIEESDIIKAKIPRDGTGTFDRQWYNSELVRIGSADIILGAAGSPASLASTTAMIFWGDEPAKWRKDFKGEGGAVGLGKKRVKAFPQTGKVVLFSTPPQIVDEENDFWTEFVSGTLERVFVRCQSCGFYGPFSISGQWGLEGDGTKCFRLEHKAKKSGKGLYDLVEVEETTECICPACKAAHTDREKPAMIRDHEWQPGNPAPDPGQVSMWLNRLYQPGVRFGVVLSDWFKANRTERGRMEFLLQEMAQPYRPKTNKIDTKAFAHLLQDYDLGTVPKDCGAVSLVLTSDVQDLEVPWTLWAVRNQEAWLVNFGEGYEFADLKEVARTNSDATALPFHGAFMDAGHRTRKVYEFCHDAGERWIPVHGRDMQKLLQWSKDLDVERGLKRKTSRPRIIQALLWQNFGWKTELYQGIIGRDPERPPTTKLWLPRDIVKHPAFLKQLSAEKLETPKRGRPIWREFRANHWGDCTCELLVYLEVYRGRLSAPVKISANALAAQGAAM